MHEAKRAGRRVLRWRVAGDFAELQRWQPAYGRFLERLNDYRLFYQPGWLQALWPAYSLRPARLFFIAVFAADELIALAPFQCLEKGFSQGWRKVLCFVGTQHPTLTNPWPDILVAAEELREPALRAILEALAAQASHWDRLELHQWPADSPNVALLRELWGAQGFRPETDGSAQIALPQGHAPYAAGLSKNMLAKLRRCRRRLEEQGRVTFHDSATISTERWQAITAIHERRQQRLGGRRAARHCLFTQPREAGALRSALDWAQTQGKARHYWLDLDGEPLAFGLGLTEGRSYFSYVNGLDPRAEPWSAGMQLLLHLTEAEAARGSTDIDLLFGLSWYKTRMANAQRTLCACRRDNAGWPSQLRNAWVDLAKQALGKASGFVAPSAPAGAGSAPPAQEV